MKLSLLISVIFLSACESSPPIYRSDDTTLHSEVSCSSINHGAKTLVLLTFGQSNAANSVEGTYIPSHPVYTAYNGRCYHTIDPVLGAAGHKSSVWPRLADKILATTDYTNVILLASGVGGSRISSWQQGQSNYEYMFDQYSQATASGIFPNLALFHQGEADLDLTYIEYLTSLLTMTASLREDSITVPLYIARASYCFGVSSSALLDAQTDTALLLPDVHLGPNTDTLDSSYRYDDCHFTAEGADAHADLWFQSIKEIFNED